MKHYLSVIKEDSRAIFEYEDKTDAMSAFHHEMEYAYNAKITTLCLVINANGNVVETEKFTAPPTPEPEIEGGEGE